MTDIRKMLRGAAVAWLVLMAIPGPLMAADEGAVSRWLAQLLAKIIDPWFVFGMVAQGVFFGRFLVQWIVSEKRKRSTVPVAFWYLSLIGGLLTLVYAVKMAEPVFMLGQLLACTIYARNLMLIYGRRGRIEQRRRARGLQEELPDHDGQGAE